MINNSNFDVIYIFVELNPMEQGLQQEPTLSLVRNNRWHVYLPIDDEQHRAVYKNLEVTFLLNKEEYGTVGRQYETRTIVVPEGTSPSELTPYLPFSVTYYRTLTTRAYARRFDTPILLINTAVANEAQQLVSSIRDKINRFQQKYGLMVYTLPGIVFYQDW